MQSRKKKVAVIGSGGREAALVATLRLVADVDIFPGNPGIHGSSNKDLDELLEQGFLDGYDLIVFGPEQPLVDGYADRCRARGLNVFGPGADGAQIEGHKDYMKELISKLGILTAQYASFAAKQIVQAEAYLRERWAIRRQVVKTDGLAGGKGVELVDDLDEILQDLRDKLTGVTFGAAGTTVVIEDYLEGEEISVFVATDGKRPVRVGPYSRDRKFNANGKMTGGMAAHAPAVDKLMTASLDEVVLGYAQLVIDELNARGIDYRGLLYFGLMLTKEGVFVLEINIRFGDPETQPVLKLVDPQSLLDLLLYCAQGNLPADFEVKELEGAAVNIVIAAPNYPAEGCEGFLFEGLYLASQVAGVTVYVAGAMLDKGELKAKGGRLLSVVGYGADVKEARDQAMAAVELIKVIDPATGQDVKQYLTDVALEAA